MLVIANYFIYFVSAASIFTLCLWFSYRVRLLISAQPLLRVAQMHINRQDVAIQRQSRVVHAKQCSVPPNNSITAVAAVCLLTDWSVYIKYIHLYICLLHSDAHMLRKKNAQLQTRLLRQCRSSVFSGRELTLGFFTLKFFYVHKHAT